jgi:hypothetical protein
MLRLPCVQGIDGFGENESPNGSRRSISFSPHPRVRTFSDQSDVVETFVAEEGNVEDLFTDGMLSAFGKPAKDSVISPSAVDTSKHRSGVHRANRPSPLSRRFGSKVSPTDHSFCVDDTIRRAGEGGQESPVLSSASQPKIAIITPSRQKLPDAYSSSASTQVTSPGMHGHSNTSFVVPGGSPQSTTRPPRWALNNSPLSQLSSQNIASPSRRALPVSSSTATSHRASDDVIRTAYAAAADSTVVVMKSRKL